MNISEPFIRRPVATSLLSVALLLAGVLAYRMLPVAPLPQVEFPVIQVQAQLPGASPETMASSVATPLERQFSRIAGVTEMTSTSLLGATTIVLQFDLDRSIDAAARDVQAAINAARSQLPPNLPSNPTYRKINPADAPILILALTSDALPVGRVFDAADSILAQKLSQVEGVGQVFVGGGARPAVRVRVDPNRLAQLGIGLGQVRAALGAATTNRPKGELSDPTSAWGVSCQLAALRRRSVPAGHRRVPQRRAGPAGRHRRGRELGRGRAHRRPGQLQAGGAAHRLPAARRQHDRDRGPHPGADAGAAGIDSRRRSASRSCSTAPRPSAPRSATSRSRCCCPSRWWSSWCSSSCAASRPR